MVDKKARRKFISKDDRFVQSKLGNPKDEGKFSSETQYNSSHTY